MADLRLCLIVLLLIVTGTSVAKTDPVVFGSKAFTESVILGEIAGQNVRESGSDVEHRRQLGGTRVLWSALVRGDIDCYPEYKGTLRTEIFAANNISDDNELRNALARES